MSRSGVAVLALLTLAVVGCGGGGTGTPVGSRAPGQTAASGQSAAPGQSTPAVVVPGEPIDTAAVTAAIDALQAMDSWMFSAETITQSVEGGVRNTITGTERRQPETAVDAQHFQSIGGEPFHYVRIGNDIWFDVGTGTYTEVQAADAENLIEQYEPYYLTNLAESALLQDWQYEPVGTEFVSTIDTMHYRLSEGDLEDIVQITDLTPDQWGGDVWIAVDGGYLVQLAWGPQTPATAQISIGYFYTVTDVNCTCPIEPPG